MRVFISLTLVAAAAFLLSHPGADAATAGRAPARPVTTQDVPSLTSKESKRNHPAFANAGTRPGIEIWRIKSFEPEPVGAGQVGKFHTGDSYIILSTKEDSKGKLAWDIYFWLGAETTQDESGSAAILSVGLDDKLGGGPVQHRETQGYESAQFTGLFKPAMTILSGGYPTGFTHVTTNAGAEKRMFQVKGKKNIRTRQIAPSVSDMNKGDCFILDVDHDIYVYVGPKASRVEKLRATSFANQIRDDDHHGRAKIDIVDEFSSDFDIEKFFTALGSGSKASVPEDTAGGDDAAFERSEADHASLVKISDDSGKMQSVPVTQKPFSQDALNENDCFILDTVSGGIYAWIGKRCNDKERTEVMARAQQYLKDKHYPAWARVTRVPQNTEPAIFKQYFGTWRDHGAQHSRIIRAAGGAA